MQRFDLKNEDVWDWRFKQHGQDSKLFSVTFGPDGKVSGSAIGEDPRETANSGKCVPRRGNRTQVPGAPARSAAACGAPWPPPRRARCGCRPCMPTPPTSAWPPPAWRCACARRAAVWVQTLKGRGDGLMRRLEHEVRLPPQRGVPALDPQRHAGTRGRRLPLALALGRRRRAAHALPHRHPSPAPPRAPRRRADRDRLRPRPHHRRRPRRGGGRDRVRTRQRPACRAAVAGGALGGALRPVVGRAHQVRTWLPAGAGARPGAGGEGRCRRAAGRRRAGRRPGATVLQFGAGAGAAQRGRDRRRHRRARTSAPAARGAAPAALGAALVRRLERRRRGRARAGGRLARTLRPPRRGARRRRAGARPAAGAGGRRRAALRLARRAAADAGPGEIVRGAEFTVLLLRTLALSMLPAARTPTTVAGRRWTRPRAACCAAPGAACCATPRAFGAASVEEQHRTRKRLEALPLRPGVPDAVAGAQAGAAPAPRRVPALDALGELNDLHTAERVFRAPARSPTRGPGLRWAGWRAAAAAGPGARRRGAGAHGTARRLAAAVAQARVDAGSARTSA